MKWYLGEREWKARSGYIYLVVIREVFIHVSQIASWILPSYIATASISLNEGWVCAYKVASAGSDSVQPYGLGSSVHRMLQTTVLEWVAMPSSRGSSRPRDQNYISYVSCTGRQVFTTNATWEAQMKDNNIWIFKLNNHSLNLNIYILSLKFKYINNIV